MVDENKNQPTQTLEAIEQALEDPNATPKELQLLIKGLEEDITKPDYLRTAKEIEVKLIREKIKPLIKLKLKGNAHKQSRRTIRAILSHLPEETIELDGSELEVVEKEGEFDEKLFKKFENEIRKNTSAQLLVAIISGNTKALKKRGYEINQEQLRLLAREIITTERGGLQNFSKNKREAIVLLMDLGFSPLEIAEDGVTIVALKEKLKPYKGEATQKIETAQGEATTSTESNDHDLFGEIISDDLLSSIFVELHDESFLKERLKALGFPIQSTEQLKEIIQKIIQNIFNQTVKREEVLDNKILSKVVKNEAGLQKFKKALEKALSKPQATPIPIELDIKTTIPAPPIPKLTPPETPKLDTKEEAQEEIDNNLDEAAFKIAPTEYKKWKDVFGSLHYGRPPSNNKEREKWLKTRKEIFGAESIEEFETIRSSLRKIEKWRKIIDAKNSPQAIRAAFSKKEIENENLGEKLKQKIEELLNEIKKIQAKIKPRKEIESSPEANTPPPSTPKPKPKAATAPKAKEITQKSLDSTLEDFAKRNPEYETLLKITNEFLGLDIKNSKALKSVKENIQKLFKNLEIVTSDGAEIPEEFLKDFFENGLKPNERILKRAIKNLKEMANLTEEEKRAFYRLLGLGKLRPKFDQLITILDTDADKIKDEQKRRYLVDIQEEILEEFDEIYHDYPIFELKTLRLKHQQEKTNEILKKLNNLDEFIEFFEAQIQPELKKEETKTPENSEVEIETAEDENKGAEATSETKEAEKITQPTTDKPKSVPKASSKLASFVQENEKRIEAKKEENSLGLERSTEKLLTEVLMSKRLISEKDPICMAINELLKGRDDVEEIKKFLQNPDSLTKSVGQKAKESIQNEMTNKGIDNYDDLTKSLKEELEEINEFFELLKSRSLSAEEKKLRPDKVKRKLAIKRLMENIALTNQLEKGIVEYSSPREVLALIMFYLHQSKEGITIEGLASRMDQVIYEQKEKLHKGFWSKINTFGFFLKPTLKSTLKAIAKDKEFSGLGEDPEAKIMELNQLFGSDYTHVRGWTKNLEGGIEKHTHTTIPRLIAYLETAIRDGKASHLLKVNDAINLVNNLKQVQREQVRKEVEIEFKQYLKEHPGEEPPNKMLMYINKLNESNEHMSDINKKLIEKNVNKSAVLKTLGLGGVIAGTVLNPLAWWTAIPGMISAGAFLSSRTNKKLSEDQKALVQRSAARAFVGNALVLGGMASTAAIGMAAIPLTIAGGLAGVAVPEIWKHRGKLGKWSLKGMGATGKLAWKKAIRPTLPYTLPFAGIAAVAGLPLAATVAAFVGIPVGTYHLTKKLRS